MKRLALILFLGFAGIAGAQAAAPQVLAKIRVGTHPCSAVEANGRLWVTNFVSHTVSVVDPKRNRVLSKPIKVDSQPCGNANRAQATIHVKGGFRCAIRGSVVRVQRQLIETCDERSNETGRTPAVVDDFDLHLSAVRVAGEAQFDAKFGCPPEAVGIVRKKNVGNVVPDQRLDRL